MKYLPLLLLLTACSPYPEPPVSLLHADPSLVIIEAYGDTYRIPMKKPPEKPKQIYLRKNQY